MLIEISKIKVNDRIRKDFGNIGELASDIKANGLINPPVITPEGELIAGERRIRACELNGDTQIEVRVMSVTDLEHQLKLEISENEHRKEFSFSERVEWARLEQVERLKAKERMAQGKENFPDLETGQVRDIVAEQAGFGSGKQYDKAKYIAENATPEIIQQLDAGLISTHKAFVETKHLLREAEERAEKAERENRNLQRKYKDAVPTSQLDDAISAAVERQQEENAAFVAQKEKEAETQLKQRDEYWKSELKDKLDAERLKVEQLNSGYQRVREELEALRLNRPDDFDEQQAALQNKKLQYEADRNTLQCTIYTKQFLEKAGITSFMLGAIASASSSEKKRLNESLDMLQAFIDQVRPAINSRKVV